MLLRYVRTVSAVLAVEPWSRGAVEPWSRGAVEPWSRGAVEPWSRGAVEPWSSFVGEALPLRAVK
jgi:hypothetical protein